MRQVRKDMPRDSMQINGVRFTGISGDRAVHLVFQAIEKYILTAKKSSGSFSQRLDTADRLPALRLARRVVLGSSRTYLAFVLRSLSLPSLSTTNTKQVQSVAVTHGMQLIIFAEIVTMP